VQSRNLSTSNIKAFQKYILSWYAINKCDLPWRKTRNPYAILVSEIMSQQTQINRVIPKYTLWMELFPTIETLAKAAIADVLAVWSGLGYNKRALYLKKIAQDIHQNYNGIFPENEKQLMLFSGIGTYTARAILCFAFNYQIAVVDTNVKKVIALTFFQGDVPSEIILEKIATMLLPKNKAYAWNQALMDYARVVLKGKRIFIPRQSAFFASDRYYRGRVVRLLLDNKKLSWDQLEKTFCIERERFKKIISSLEKDNLIIKTENFYYSLP
jgi:A/G-specific adenine glycosylase